MSAYPPLPTVVLILAVQREEGAMLVFKTASDSRFSAAISYANGYYHARIDWSDDHSTTRIFDRTGFDRAALAEQMTSQLVRAMSVPFFPRFA